MNAATPCLRAHWTAPRRLTIAGSLMLVRRRSRRSIILAWAAVGNAPKQAKVFVVVRVWKVVVVVLEFVVVSVMVVVEVLVVVPDVKQRYRVVDKQVNIYQFHRRSRFLSHQKVYPLDFGLIAVFSRA